MSGKESPGAGVGPPVDTAAEVEISTAADTSPTNHMVTSPPPGAQQIISPITQIPVSPQTQIPQVIQGPQPLPNPQPAPPKLSPHEIQLITEAAAKQGPNGTYQCSLCNKNFGYKNGLVRHIRLTHVGEKPYECTICHRRFGYKHILMEHQNLHFGNRPYACTMCDKKFAARSNLIQHRMVHKRPFQCTMCNKRFDKEDQLKKHMYAHPQTMLQCTLCKKNCNNENDLKKHIAKVHPNELTQTEVKVEPLQVHQNGQNGALNMHIPPPPPTLQHNPAHPIAGLPPPPSQHPSLGGHQPTEPISPPAGASPDGHAQAPHTPPGHTTPPLRTIPQNLLVGGAAGERGQRIDAICSQLVTSIAQPPHHEHPHTPSPQPELHHGIIIKKELERQVEFDPRHPDPSQSPRIASTGSAEYQRVASTGSAEYQQVNNLVYSTSHDLPRASVAAMYTQPPAAVAVEDIPMKEEAQQGLPGIHEMFSRKAAPKITSAQTAAAAAAFPGCTAATFAAMPALISTDSRMALPHDLPLNLMSPPPAASYPNMAPGTSSIISSAVNQRPTAQLPPITQHDHKPTSDQAVQHYTPIPGFPSLDDVITYYVNQGTIFKCQHCNIIFFERGMFFLHASLHSSSNPWECSICNKVCTDRNEFTLHFVNQQHT